MLATLMVTMLILAACSGAPTRSPGPGPEPGPRPDASGPGQEVPAVQPPVVSEAKPAEPGAPKPKEPEQKQSPTLTTIRVLAPFYPSIEHVIPVFHAKYPNYRVELINPPPTDGIYDKEFVRNAIAKGELDLVRFDHRDLDFLIKENLLLPLDPYVQKTGFDLKPLGPSADVLRWDGQLLDLPMEIVPKILIYNRDRFAAAGVAPPRSGWTWEEFREAAHRLTAGEGPEKQWGFSADYQHDLVNLWVYQKTGLLPWQAEEATFREALQFFVTMIHSDKSIKPDTNMNRPGWRPPREFWDGKAGMFLTGAWSLNALAIQAKFGYDVAPLPGKPVSMVFPTTFAIPATTPHADAAWALLSLMAGEEGAAALAKAGQLPMYITPKVRQAWFDRQPAPPPGTATLFETTWVMEPRSLNESFYGAPLGVSEVISNALSGRKSWEEAYKDYQALMQNKTRP